MLDYEGAYRRLYKGITEALNDLQAGLISRGISHLVGVQLDTEEMLIADAQWQDINYDPKWARCKKTRGITKTPVGSRKVRARCKKRVE